MSRSSWAAPRAAALLGHLLFAVAAPVSADEVQPIEAASRLFEKGAEQQRRGDFKGAAASFARADELVPDAAALEAALRASMLADDPVLGMTLTERANRSPPPPRLAHTLDLTRTKFAKRVGRLTVRCAACSVTVDARTIDANVPAWLSPGDHDVVIRAGGRSDRRTLHIDQGSSTDVVPLETPAAVPPQKKQLPLPVEPPSPSFVRSPVWFWVAVGTTAAATGATIASALDTQSVHEEFQRNPTASGGTAGNAAETRTNVLIGVTAALGLATAGLGLFVTRWSPEPPITATLTLTNRSLQATVQTSF